MSDFPGILNNPSRLTLSTFGQTCTVSDHAAMIGANFSAGAVWPAANRALYIPVTVESTVTVYQMGIVVTTQSGNVDVGVYDSLGTRLVSMGSTAVAAAGFQAFDIADTVLTPGLYYLAMCASSATAAFRQTSTLTAEMLRCSGVQQQAVGAVTLPDPATFANPATAYCPALMASTRVTL